MNYTANEKGEIFNELGYQLNPYKHSDGYLQFKAYHEGGCTTTHYVHRFTWQQFRGDIPKGYQINHINEDKTDNRLENLELVTQKENIQKRSYNKLNMEKAERIRQEYAEKESITFAKLAAKYDCNPSTIRDVVRHKTWSTSG